MMQTLQNKIVTPAEKTESFTIVHSGKSRSTYTNAPWIRFTKRVLAEHDPDKEILITSAGMLHYDIVLRAWFNMGGYSKVILHQALAEWPEYMQIHYKWLENNPAVDIVQPDSPMPRCGHSSAAAIKKALYFTRDERVLSSASRIETGCMNRNGRMHGILNSLKQRSGTVRYRRLSQAEKSGNQNYKPTCYKLPESIASFNQYIWHFTRTRYTPWPGETMAEYLDNLLGMGRPAPYPAGMVLQRIINEKRIQSNTYLVRGNIPVVCFCGASWGTVRNLFTWQNHLRRYRFEPYAIGIHKSELTRQGILPVIYAPDAVFRQLSPHDRWRFQKFDRYTVKWVDEAEWRSRSDVDLSVIPDDKLAVFTPEGLQNWHFGSVIASI
jgi:hypothetical protein